MTCLIKFNNNNMSGSTSAAAKLTLIANPKSRKDWENNQAYYQEKFFSRKQKQVLKEAKRKEEIAWKEIRFSNQPESDKTDERRYQGEQRNRAGIGFYLYN